MRLLFLLCCLILPYTLAAQQTIRGVIKDAKSSETLPGVILQVKNTEDRAITDDDGAFSLTTNAAFPISLVVTYTGYATQEILVQGTVALSISMKSSQVLLKNVQVRGSRISEKLKESPLTVESMDIIGIRETPNANFYEGLGQLKGVDLVSASMAFKVLNTRGFSSTSPVRSLQLIDGVDNQSPGLNFSLGNFLGASELDMQKVELVVGASSAYFGPNAFNGVIAMTTRSPFSKPGLEVTAKMGERSLFEGGVRWAQVFKNKKGAEKLGYKLNLSYLRALDWEADNLSATPQSRNKDDNPGGYDAVNVYGDEFLTGSDYTESASAYPGLGAFYRKGYNERDLVNYKTYSLKANGALHYRINPDVEAIYASSFSTGTTIYRGDNPVLLKDVLFFQNRVEVRREGKWFVRAYATNEDAGKTYDIYTTGLLLQQSSKSDDNFKKDYEIFWNSNYGLGYIRTLPGFPQPPTTGPDDYVKWQNSINPYLYANYYDSVVAWHGAAQAYANGDSTLSGGLQYFEPGSSNFDTALAGITSRSIAGGKGNGSRYIDRSALYHAQAEYRFTPQFCDIVAGGNFRMYVPNSEGTIFSDTAGTRIRNTEVGLYGGVEKRVMQDKLKINLTARLDKNQNFPFLFSPAASLVYQPAPDQYLRVSFSSAIRNPTLQDQYLYLFVGRALLAGNTQGYSGLVTLPSLGSSFDSDRSFDSLSFFDVQAVRPERVKTLEAGYRATLLKRLYLDISGYYSWYKDFIGYKLGADIDTSTVQLPFGGTYRNIQVNNILRVATNAVDGVNTMGATIGLNYYVGQYFAFVGNYSWNRLDRRGSADPLIPAFNTPEHKFNLGFNARNFHGFSFNANYKWISGFRFEGSPQFSGPIDTYDLLDAQVSRQFTKLHTTLKVGANNILNNLHYEVYGGPLIGRLMYVSLLYSMNQ